MSVRFMILPSVNVLWSGRALFRARLFTAITSRWDNADWRSADPSEGEMRKARVKRLIDL